MKPREYEKLAAKHFVEKGYQVELTQYAGDYGIDIFALRNEEKVAVQVKMFGSTSRKINRRMVMELHGAKDYFNCTKAIIITDGDILPDAKEVADKLNIEIYYLMSKENHANDKPETQDDNNKVNFDFIWEKYIMPLQGKTLIRGDGSSNKIVRVDWGGIERITSNGNKGTIEIEIFKKAISHIFEHGFITRIKINDDYDKRASSGIILILAQVPFFRLRHCEGAAFSDYVISSDFKTCVYMPVD